MIQSNENERINQQIIPHNQERRMNTVIVVVLFLCLVVIFLVVQFTDFVGELNFSKVSYREIQQRITPLEYIQQHFPECLSSTGIIDLAKMGRYVRKSKRSKFRYDHSTCFVMKHRYNCARPSNYTEPVAADYELVLNLQDDDDKTTSSSHNSNKACRIGHLVDALGGPTNILNIPTAAAAHNTHETTSTRRTSDASTPLPLQIVISGDSYLRQIFEALTCSFSDQITRMRLSMGGPSMSMKAMKERNNVPFQTNEVGSPIDDLYRIKTERCQEGWTSSYYRDGVLNVPNTSIPSCNDNLGMVEFDHRVQFYYIFRPGVYSDDALEHIYSDFFELKDTRVRMFYNTALGKKSDITPTHITRESSININDWKNKMKDVQKQDLGIYYGADNPWITNPPDQHPWYVNIVLFIP
jgi:hypothetical protein